MSSDSTQLDPRPTSHGRFGSRPLTLLASLLLAGLVIASAGIGVWSDQGAGAAGRDYEAQRQQLEAAIARARGAGYTAADLASVTGRLRGIEAERPPLVIVGLGGFGRRRLAEMGQLRGSLQGRLAAVLDEARVAAGADLDRAGAEIEKDRRLGLDDASASALADRRTALLQRQGTARTLPQVRSVDGDALRLLAEARTTGRAQAQENAAVQEAAQQLIVAKGGDIEGIRQVARDALFTARNEATVAAYMSYGHELAGDVGSIEVPSQRLERYAPLAGSADVTQVALAAAAGQRYEAQVKDALGKAMPAKTIVVSYQGQALSAYQGGQVAQSTLVTTGRPQLPTDMGPMRVLHKDSPWQMKSPWPKESPWYYPPTWVKMVLWFTNTGEGLHDADWEYASQYGPGGQFGGGASHGCIHVPYDTETWLYGWGDVGTPVVVYPGDGSPVADQMKRMTTDDQGVPANGPGYRGA